VTHQTFSIGEKALLLASPPGTTFGRVTPYFGTELTVVSALHEAHDCEGGYAYTCTTFDGRWLECIPEALQKLPPQDPAFLKFRDELVRANALDAEPPVLEPRHPAIVALLDFIGQSAP
jgi:hypothetical protein